MATLHQLIKGKFLSLFLKKEGFVWLTVITALVLTSLIIVKVLHIGFWRHDDVIYVSNLTGKLRTEARWVNHILFNFLHPMNGHVAWFLAFAGIAGFFYRVARLYTTGNVCSILLALICLQYPGFYSLTLWPGLLVPGSFLLVASTFLAPVMSIWIFFSIFGVLFFGTSPQLYFFLPLLFLGKNSRFLSKPSAVLYKLIPAWAFGFILGYFFASALNLVFIGQFGFTLAGWRGAKPVTGLSSLVENVTSRIMYLQEHIFAIIPNRLLTLFLGLVMVCHSFWQRRQGRFVWLLVCWVVCISILLVHYVMTIPSGIHIQYRSLHHVFVAVIFFFIFISVGWRTQGIYLVSIFFIVGLPMWGYSYAGIKWYSDTTSIMVDDLQKAAPTYDGLIVDAKNFAGYYASVARRVDSRSTKFMEGLNAPHRWSRVGLELGFKDVILCEVSPEKPLSNHCALSLSPYNEITCAKETDKICVLGVRNNLLLVRLLP